MGKCVVCNVENFEVSYHRLPKTPERRKKWIEKLKLGGARFSDFSTVCSLHFNRSDFNRLRLRKGVVPRRVTYDENGINKAGSTQHSQLNSSCLRNPFRDVTNCEAMSNITCNR